MFQAVVFFQFYSLPCLFSLRLFQWLSVVASPREKPFQVEIVQRTRFKFVSWRIQNVPMTLDGGSIVQIECFV